MDYVDTSALIKAYVVEAGTPEFVEWLASEGLPCVSELSVVEFRASVRRRERTGELAGARVKAILGRFDRHLVDGTLERLSWPADAFAAASRTIDHVAPLPLRTLDALHLAVARLRGCIGFASADRNQLKAAHLLGLETHAFLHSS